MAYSKGHRMRIVENYLSMRDWSLNELGFGLHPVKYAISWNGWKVANDCTLTDLKKLKETLIRLNKLEYRLLNGQTASSFTLAKSV